MAQVPDEWRSYRDALPGAYTATLDDAADQPPFDEKSADELLARSDALGTAIAEHLSAERGDVREMAALQLQAAAAVDMDGANTLAAMDGGGGYDAALSSDGLSTIDTILSTPTENGISSVLPLADEGFEATASDKVSLRDAVDAAVDSIVRDAERAAKTTVGGLTGFAELELATQIGKGVGEAFDLVGDKLNWLKRKALALVLKAIEKLLSIFGPATEGARKTIASWAGDLEEGKVIHLLQRLYAVEKLKSQFGVRIEGVEGGVPESRDDAARTELRTLEGKWHLRTSVIDTLGRVGSHARTWILPLTPYGPIAYGTGFALATGYVVLAGGDYLDWREGQGLLNLVEGVGAIVHRAIEP